MLRCTRSRLSVLEAAANDSSQLLFAKLRELGLAEFALLLEAQPLIDFPNLSGALPRKTSSETQRLFTGADGKTLLIQSLDFVRYFRDQVITHAHLVDDALSKARILDFGCGWGRLLRLMYYYFERDGVIGVDPWQRAVDECLAAGLGPNIHLIDRSADSLSEHGVFDAGYAFSVFTHLPHRLMQDTLGNLFRSIRPGGLLLITIRPLEYWNLRIHQAEQSNKPEAVARFRELLEEHKKQGFAFYGNGPYGDSSMEIDWFDRAFPQWELLQQDRSLNDTYQIYVTLRPRK